MGSKRSQSKSRSASRSRTTKTAKSPARSPAKKPTPKKTPAKTPQKKSASKSRSQSGSRKAHTAPAAQCAPTTQKSGRTTPVARPSRSRSRTRTNATSAEKVTQRIVVSTITARPTSSYFEEQTRPRRGVATYGTAASDAVSSAASASGRTARYLAKNAQQAPWRVTRWLNAVKTAGVQKWRRSCLNRPSAAKVKRHFTNNAKHYFTFFVVLLLAVVVYKFQREILTQVREMQVQLAEFVETQRKIFGDYVEKTQKALLDAKQKYLTSDEDSASHRTTTPTPAVLKKETLPPQQETYRQQQKNQQRQTVV